MKVQTCLLCFARKEKLVTMVTPHGVQKSKRRRYGTSDVAQPISHLKTGKQYACIQSRKTSKTRNCGICAGIQKKCRQPTLDELIAKAK